ncbi:unnamed protein product [Rhodiola kirilowii]
MLLRRLFSSGSNRSGPSRGASDDRRVCLPPLTAGAFDLLPIDLLMEILKLIEPKDAARLCAVCRSMKLLISDNRLWIYYLYSHPDPDHILYSETELRYGFPLQSTCNEIPPVFFKQIYGQREQVPGVIVIDGGSGYCKFGWNKCSAPSGKSTTFLEFGNIESPMYSRLRHFFSTIYTRLQAKASAQPVIVSIPLCHYDDTESARASRKQLREAIYSTLFDLNVPAVCAVNQATLALFAAKRTSGIVVNIGFQVTSIVPILHGKIMRRVGVEVVGMGALKLTGFLKELMQQNGINFDSLYTVRTLKENLCYVAYDYESELSKNTRASYEVDGEGWLTLSKERFQTGEILFQPRLGGVLAMGLHQAVALCMEHCQSAGLTIDDSWYKTVVLSGGTACLPGLTTRLEKELHDLLPRVSGVEVIPSPKGADSAWYGAKLISSLSTFPGSWCKTKKLSRRRPRVNFLW